MRISDWSSDVCSSDLMPRGMFGPHFLASLVFQKYGLHQPLNSQRDRLESEGIPLSLSTLADQIGAVSAANKPLFLLMEAHVLAAERLPGDDTTVPLPRPEEHRVGKECVMAG